MLRFDKPEPAQLIAAAQTVAAGVELEPPQAKALCPPDLSQISGMQHLCKRLFAIAWCDDCGHDYFVAFSCKGRCVCPSCYTRRMVETAAHMMDHVFPRPPLRQWLLSGPKRLRYFMQLDGAVLGMTLRIFLRVIAQSLQSKSPGAALHIGAIAFIHRFGSSLNAYVHFHVCAVDGVFEEVH